MSAKIKRSTARSSHRHSHKPKGISHKSFAKVYWPYIPVILIISILLFMNSQTGALATFFRQPDGKVLSYATQMSINGLLADTNTARTADGMGALKLNDKLDAAAQAKANDMAARDYWSHNTPDGNPPWVFVTSQNYNYQKLGENLAAGFADEQSTINGWLASPPHRENLLDPAYSEVGFGFTNISNYTATGGGPMTVVVAFYGEPQVQSATISVPVAGASALPIQPAGKSSRAQLALASWPLSRFGTTLAIMAASAAVGIWLSRHILAVRRAVAYGERFVIKHPLLDIGLLTIAALSFFLTQTAGFIH